VIVTVPAPVNATTPVRSPTVAREVLLLAYVTAPVLALLAETVKAASVTLLAVGALANARVGTPLHTVSVLLLAVALVNCPATASCVALKLTAPTPTTVIQFPEASIVATLVLLLLYKIAPLLLLEGRVLMLKAASP
jgi:hypothetical protein